MLRVTGAAMGGPEAIEYMETLAESVPDEMRMVHKQALNAFRNAISRNIPVEPQFHPGKYSKIYDNYTCGRCGYLLDMIGEEYCPNCGQRTTTAWAGRRMTREEQKKSATPAAQAAIDELAATYGEN